MGKSRYQLRVRILGPHLGKLGRYISVAVEEDLHGQAGDGICLGMLLGCAGHDAMEATWKIRTNAPFRLGSDSVPVREVP